MISATNYYSSIVLPTVEEFRRNNGDIRLAMLASQATLHVLDYIAQNKESDGKAGDRLREELEKQALDTCFSFRVVRGFALAAKHCRLRKRNLEGFTSQRYKRTYPSIMGRARAGATFLGDTVGGVAIKWEEHEYVNLTKALNLTLQYYEITFEELKVPPNSA